MKTAIVDITALEILDSRGNPTVEVEVTLADGSYGRASVPSGASTGAHEACELRDGSLPKNHFEEAIEPKKRYGGKGVIAACMHVQDDIAPEIEGWDACEQTLIDAKLCSLDGTENKKHLGANAILATSLAVARAAAASLRLPLFRYLGGIQASTLPQPMMNILNGGAHSDAPVDIQEIMIVPQTAPSFSEALRMGAEIFHALKDALRSENLSTSVGDEGGFAPAVKSTTAALDLIAKAVKKAGYTFGTDVTLALDAAASEFYDSKTKRYVFKKSTGKAYTADELVSYYEDLINDYPITSLEDGCDQNDWKGWKVLTERLGEKIQLVGDDIFVTNPHFVQKGIDEGIANAVLIKPNQIGTLTETLDTMALARGNGYNCILSHRSGETEDTFIAHLAVATNCGQIKTGSLCRTDRICKYNALLRIEHLIDKAPLRKLQAI